MTPEPSPSASDAALLRRYRQGDAAAFGELYARHRQGLFRFLLGLCGEHVVGSHEGSPCTHSKGDDLGLRPGCRVGPDHLLGDDLIEAGGI